jgi:hypothetical protein
MRSKIQTIAAPAPPTGPPKATPSVSRKLAWSLPTRNQFGATTPNPKPSQKPFGGPPPPAPLPGPPLQPPQNPNSIGVDEEPLQGKEPPVFDGDQQEADHFLHELRLYQFVNATHPAMANPWQKVAHALTYVSGPVTTFPSYFPLICLLQTIPFVPHACSRFASHVTLPSVATLLSIIICRHGSPSSLSWTLTHYAYFLISDILYNTQTCCGRPFPGPSCI